MSTKNKKKVKDELFLDALSDCSEDSDMEDVETSDDESDDNDSVCENKVNTLWDPDWCENDMEFELKAYNRISGLNIKLENQENIWEFVQLFLGDDLFELFVTETNRYHSQVVKTLKQYSAVKWTDVTVTEMKKFLGLIILMGQMRKDDVYDYWSTFPCIETPIFQKTMSRNRFKQIWRMWHFCNNDLLVDKSDKLFKIKEVLNYIQYKFQTVYTPKQELILQEEGRIPGRNGLSFRYNPEKVLINGIQVRLLCEATSGYICNFTAYSSRVAMSQDTILPIFDPFVGFNHHIYMNHYNNSVETAEILLQENTRICGTIRASKGFPQCLKNVKLKEHETKFARKGHILIQIWQVRRNQTIKTISTIHSAEMVNVSRGGGDGTEPKSVADYNKFMTGINRADQYMSYYNILRKSTKWAKKAVLYFLNAALFNSFQVYKKINNNKLTYKKFLRQVAVDWIDSRIETGESENLNNEEARSSNATNITRRAPRVDPPDRLSQNFKQHKLVPIVTNGRTTYPHRKCRVCTANKKTRFTRYVCEYCNVPLHKLECFQRYHTLKKY